MWSGVCEMVHSSVHESVFPICPVCGRFAAVGQLGRRYGSIVAAAVCGGGQCHVVGVCRKLKTDLLVTGLFITSVIVAVFLLAAVLTGS